MRVGVTISDYLTGVFAAQAAIGALYARDARGGKRRGDRRRALRRGAAHPRVDARRVRPARHRAQPRGQPARELARRSTTTPPPTASTCASSPAPTRTSRACARRWTGPTCSTTRASPSSSTAPRTATRSTASSPTGPRRSTAAERRGALRRARRAGRDRVHRGRHVRRPALRGPRRPRDRRRSGDRPDAPAGAVPALRRRAGRRCPRGAPVLGEHTDEVLRELGSTVRRRARRSCATEGVDLMTARRADRHRRPVRAARRRPIACSAAARRRAASTTSRASTRARTAAPTDVDDVDAVRRRRRCGRWTDGHRRAARLPGPVPYGFGVVELPEGAARDHPARRVRPDDSDVRPADAPRIADARAPTTTAPSVTTWEFAP